MERHSESTESWSWCEHCSLIFDLVVSTLDERTGECYGELEVPDGRKDLHPEYPSLTASIAAGCQGCELLRGALRERVESMLCSGVNLDGIIKNQQLIQIKKTSKFFDPAKGSKRGLHTLKVVAIWGESFEWPFMIHLDAERDSMAFKNSLIHYSRPSSEPLCHYNLQKVKRLIEQCLEDHIDCRRHFTSASLPTRLIDVGTLDSTQLCLVNSKNLLLSVPYVALSHVWGNVASKPFLRTTRATLECMEQCICPADLPATFRDAIQVTRYLGLRYIWIDSLCIVQDDSSDWQKESEQMADVYSHAYVTIVPVCATSAHDGFLDRQQSSSTKIMHLPGVSDPKFDHFYAAHRNPGFPNSRGFPSQSGTLVDGHSKRESYPGDFFTSLPANYTSRMSTMLPRAGSTAHTQDRPADATVPIGWYTVWVTDFTRRALSEPKDRLPALRGLANMISASVDDLYLHGLWASDIGRGLLWKFSFNGPPRLQACVDTATWTWARWQDAIDYSHLQSVETEHEFTPCFKLLSTKGLDDGRGHKPDCILEIKGKVKNFDAALKCFLTNHSAQFDASEMTFEEAGTTSTFAFLVGSMFSIPLDSSMQICLLLKAVNGEPNRYKRVGIIQVTEFENLPALVALGADASLDVRRMFNGISLQTFELV